MEHYQPALAHKLLDRSPDRVSADAVLVSQLQLTRQPHVNRQLTGVHLCPQIVGNLLPQQARRAVVDPAALVEQT